MIRTDRWVWDFIVSVPEMEAERWDTLIFWHVPHRAFAQLRKVGDGSLQRWDYSEGDDDFRLKLACFADRLRPRDDAPRMRAAILSGFALPGPDLTVHTNDAPRKPRGRPPRRRHHLELVK